MAKPPSRTARTPSRPNSRPKAQPGATSAPVDGAARLLPPHASRRPAPPLLPDLTRLLPADWRRSEAWKHFQAAQVEFLTGMQLLLNDCLERLKLPEESERELRRITVQK